MRNAVSVNAAELPGVEDSGDDNDELMEIVDEVWGQGDEEAAAAPAANPLEAARRARAQRAASERRRSASFVALGGARLKRASPEHPEARAVSAPPKLRQRPAAAAAGTIENPLATHEPYSQREYASAGDETRRLRRDLGKFWRLLDSGPHESVPGIDAPQRLAPQKRKEFLKGFLMDSEVAQALEELRMESGSADEAIAALKNEWRECELLGDRNGGRPLNYAADCVAYSNRDGIGAKKNKKEEGFEDTPNNVRKSSSYSVEKMSLHLTDPSKLHKLRQLRDRFDVNSVPGTRSHFHWQFLGQGKLRFRWLPCCCFSCRDGNFDACFNVPYIGGWTNFTFKRAEVDGVAQRKRIKKEESDKICDELEVTGVSCTPPLFLACERPAPRI
jgi:hypothetical protein